MPMSPFLNAALFGRGGVPPRGVIKPHSAPPLKRHVVAPPFYVNNGEVSLIS